MGRGKGARSGLCDLLDRSLAAGKATLASSVGVADVTEGAAAAGSHERNTTGHDCEVMRVTVWSVRLENLVRIPRYPLD